MITIYISSEALTSCFKNGLVEPPSNDLTKPSTLFTHPLSCYQEIKPRRYVLEDGSLWKLWLFPNCIGLEAYGNEDGIELAKSKMLIDYQRDDVILIPDPVPADFVYCSIYHGRSYVR